MSSLTQPTWLHPAGAVDELELTEMASVLEELAADEKDETILLVVLRRDDESEELVILPTTELEAWCADELLTINEVRVGSLVE